MTHCPNVTKDRSVIARIAKMRANDGLSIGTGGELASRNLSGRLPTGTANRHEQIREQQIRVGGTTDA